MQSVVSCLPLPDVLQGVCALALLEQLALLIRRPAGVHDVNQHIRVRQVVQEGVTPAPALHMLEG